MLLSAIIIVPDVAGNNIRGMIDFYRVGRIEPDNAMNKIRLTLYVAGNELG